MVKCASTYYKRVINQYGISHFYRFHQSKDTHQIETSVPDVCTDIIFHHDPHRNDLGAYLYGSPLLPHAFEMIPGYHYFGVRFLPGNLPLVTDISMAETINQVIPLNNVGKHINLAELIGHQKSFESQIDMFLNFYKKSLHDQLNKDKSFGLKKYLINQILNSSGNIRVEDLADTSGYSVRYVNRMFKAEMGIPPKKFCKIVRFQRCLSDMCNRLRDSKDLNLGMLSFDLGYADESHMIRDFKEYTNRTPHEFWKELHGFQYLNRLKVV